MVGRESWYKGRVITKSGWPLKGAGGGGEAPGGREGSIHNTRNSSHLTHLGFSESSSLHPGF